MNEEQEARGLKIIIANLESFNQLDDGASKQLSDCKARLKELEGVRTMTITELDTLRANRMRELLNKEGQSEIWKYDIMTKKQAFAEALGDYDFDNIDRDGFSKKQYCLVGPGICDHPFDTTEELDSIITWLCSEGGYLGCYQAS